MYKRCVICFSPFKLSKNAKTADERTLCRKCRIIVKRISNLYPIK